MKLKTSKIIDLETKIEKIKEAKILVIKSQKFEEAAALRDTEKKLQDELAALMEQWEEYLIKQGVSDVSSFCLRIKNGKFEIVIEQANGSVILADGTEKLENGIYVFANAKWSKILGELEGLINKPDLKEQELQSFFETYPGLIMDEEYDFPIPQAIIVNDNGIEWRADFVLIPKDQIAFAKILELKLPTEEISRKEVSGHSRYSAQLYKALNQLKDYHEAFGNERTKELFKKRYDAAMFKPDLQLLFGRRESIQNPQAFLELQRRYNIEIKDWDSMLEQLKRKYK